jgi:imidazolonepropionase-like amidohydrolase
MSNFLFKNANLVLPGLAGLQTGFDVFVREKRICSVSSQPIDPVDATIIDVDGKTLMPGLIDAHAHITGLSLSPRNISYSASEIIFACSSYLRSSLMDGFTTIREAGGADHSIARLLVEGKIVGPRLFYSGRALTQTGGGADFQCHRADRPVRPCQPVLGYVGDCGRGRRGAQGGARGVAQGAAQIKLFASGGVVFPSEAHSTV